MNDIFLLLAAFQLKHFICDYPLQTKSMLGKFSPDRRVWVPALASHAAVHFWGTAIICSMWGWSTTPAWIVGGLAMADGLVHFCVDRVKASPRMLGRWTPQQREFWWALGADQMAHHLTHYAIIYALVSA